jgi:S1-C subfamily serine protease
VRLTRWSRPAAPVADGDAASDVRHPGGPDRRRTLLAAAAAALVTGLVVAVIVLATTGSRTPLDRAQVGRIASQVTQNAIKDERAAPANSAVVYQEIVPSVVLIETRGPATKRKGEERVGTGVIVNSDGSIMTAYHVVDGATSIRVTFADGTRSSAEIVSSDPAHDIAVLAPAHPPGTIVPAVLGGGAQVGDQAYAVGNPLGYVDSLTAGVVSGLDRSTETTDGKTLHGLIQFDAAVNPGNSGGPLLNRSGQVIGIVTALANTSHRDFFIGIGFAVPIGTAGGAADVPPK